MLMPRRQRYRTAFVRQKRQPTVALRHGVKRILTTLSVLSIRPSSQFAASNSQLLVIHSPCGVSGGRGIRIMRGMFVTPMVFAMALNIAPVVARSIDFPCGTAGTVTETSNGKRASITINLTNSDRNISNPDPKYGWPITIQLNGNEMPPYTATVSVGSLEGIPPHLNGFPGVCDIKQTTKILQNTGEVADLEIESIFHDPDTNQALIQDVFGTIAGKLGFESPVRVPDLFADTNGDGLVGEGDVLYSMVDVNEYIEKTVSFSLGDTFRITNGLAAGLPGMMFSSSPFIYSAATGFSGTPVDLDGTIEAFHELTPTPTIPEPMTFFLLGIGIVGLLSCGRLHNGGTQNAL